MCIILHAALALLILICLFVCLYSKTGLGRCAPKHSEALDPIVANMHKCGLPVSVLNAKEMKQRCPHLILPDNFKCVYEEDAGVLAAGKCVTALQVKSARLLDNRSIDTPAYGLRDLSHH